MWKLHLQSHSATDGLAAVIDSFVLISNMYVSESTSKQNFCANKEGCQHQNAWKQMVCEGVTYSQTDGSGSTFERSRPGPQDYVKKNRIKTQQKILSYVGNV